ncbi:MAG TPA: Gfo/Idh/MocA family oxidoreductase [Planctomycetota bacterium]|nr:Gfo/Idh/MocA family oxidoreductase [Planctomycetota bacterium]
MHTAKPEPTSRRDFLSNTGRFAAASVLTGAVPLVHPGGGDKIRIALVGCGGRGGGAAANALSVPGAEIELVAMADVFANKPGDAAEALSEQFAAKMNVPRERQFVGFDGYRKAMDCLRPGDIVILTTPPAFRWVHYSYAIEKGLNVFMEKPVAVDGPTSKRMLQLNERAKSKQLKVGVGLMSRHNHGMRDLQKRIQDGELGDVLLMRGYRMHAPAAFFRSLPKPEGISELMYQIQRFHSFLWASGGNFSDFNIHIVDHLCWMKGTWPVRAQAVGGRHYRESEEGHYIDQNFDSYAVEYTFADGTKMFFDGRCMPGCKIIYSSFAHGTKGMAVVSANGDCGLPSRIYGGQGFDEASLRWTSDVPKAEQDPYQNEWNSLIAAITAGQPYNEVDTGVKTSLVTAMGRMAAHTGQEITYDDMLAGDHEFAPDVDKLTLDSAAPLLAGPDGRYPVPMPGQKKLREY